MEKCDVATTNIHGAFLQTDMEGTVWVRLDGVITEMLLNIDPENYRDKVVIGRGKKSIYMVLKHTLCGALISSLLFWRDLVSKLKSWGLQSNPYDPSVTNKVVDGKSCTVCWYGDHLKISHVQSKVIKNFFRHLEEHYSKVTPMKNNMG